MEMGDRFASVDISGEDFSWSPSINGAPNYVWIWMLVQILIMYKIFLVILCHFFEIVH
jgi:hypothetical protein